MATPTDRQSVEDSLRDGHDALARGAWSEARELFETALEREESGEALEGLGWAGWWLSDEELTMGSRRRAFRAFRAEGDDGAAARTAAWLAADHREFRGEGAVGRGWLGRAHTLVEGLPESADHGWVRLIDADFALNLDADVVYTERLSIEVAELGRRLGEPDLEAVGLAQGGVATVLQGRIEEGMRRLDEASVIAASEDVRLPISTGWALCCLISACDGVGDFPRAAQWCGAMRDFSERWGGRQILGVCRSAYGRVLAASGDWPAAEAELTAAVGDLTASRPGMASGGLVRLGEHRARQGRGAEARELFEQAGPAGLVGLGQLDLDAGDARAAADTAERVLRAVPENVPLERLPACELLARARAVLGDDESAAAAHGEIERSVALLDTPYLRGRARLVAGEIAAARGDHDAAREGFEDAVDCLTEGSAPYEAAIARLDLAGALAALGHDERAAAEAAMARETFAALGAERDLARAAALGFDDRASAQVGEAATSGGGRGAATQVVEVATSGGGRSAETTSGDGAASELSPREVEVLRLVAQGLGDAEIAERLVVSPHTVHRHVANIRAKLRLPSRSAAVAYAAREGLL